MSPSGRKRTRLFTYRRLIVMEALLLIGALQFMAEDRVVASDFPDELKVVFIMFLVLGFLGSLLVVVERLAKSGLGTTHRTIQALPIPTPR
ncbi:MAG: hypothetical protein IH849_08250, partial [Acidobacteria bacterium]|nr:hypothetical protein [Acidobacteriota bacterium]